jgi:hypothetical protein
MNEGTHGVPFKEKTEGRKSRETVPSNFAELHNFLWGSLLKHSQIIPCTEFSI